MKIVNVTERRAKISYKCECCGDMIQAGEQYNYLKFRAEKSIKHLKSHIKCLSLASKLGMFEREHINEYNFTKSARDYIYRMQENSKKHISRKAIERYPISELVRRLDMFYADLEREKAHQTPRSFDSIRVEVALLTETLMMPSVFDNLIEALEVKGEYRHDTKVAISYCLKEFEGMSERLGAKFRGTAELETMSTSCLDVMDKIDASISLEGKDKWCNILMACISDMKSKYQVLAKEVNVKSHIAELAVIEKKLCRALKFKSFSFVGLIVAKECSEKGIRFAEENLA